MKPITAPGHPNRWLWGKRTEALDFPNRIHIKVIGNNLPAHHSYSLEIMNPYPQPIVLGGAQYHLLASLFSQGWQKDFKFVEMPITTLPPEANMVIADLKLPFADLDFPQKTVLFSIAGKEEPFPCNSVFYGLPD